ncbi:SMP-30/gluconolactonase/LRE family protein [Pseudomonas cichorii]|uniref:SMP-30/gluconolactonase/LRE family protein n=1 Tax=Pseudomonas cichorii TaxID=36746 RepID=UPI00191103C7|nr:SMP-30/gluconolactonase/LRE family protein [Pseudomonas cichorii]GFM84171.1 SMP-30/gluconolactonase/LRE family protein [Pseudomonas cichorii]GFM89469.1 SMP-30/gluconolactonase/LRE family protein [Pseudomonas cichorii]
MISAFTCSPVGQYYGRPGIKTRTVLFVTCLIMGAGFISESSARQGNVTGLAYDEQTRSVVPVPPAERALQSALAEPWFKVSDEGRILEGAIFDHNGNLLFCDVSGRRVLRLTPDRQLSTVVTLDALSPGGLALHPDGRLFIAALDIPNNRGAIIAVNQDGLKQQPIIPPEAGYMPNDLRFDTHGGFYFTDFKGNSTEPTGGVYYTAPDLTTITPVLPNLSMANGLELSPDGKTLWATEFGRNLLHRIKLTDATTIAPIGSAIAYHFTGPAPDSMRADADGNVYVAIYGQGRVMAFNRNGIPIGQVLLPGRDSGHNLASTSLAIHPDKNDLYVVTSDNDKGQGATIFHTKAFNKGLPPSSSD